MNRHSVLSVSAIAVLGLALLPASAFSQQKSLKEQIVGTWTHVSTKYKFPDGTMVDTFGSNPRGILIFDASGRVAFIAMRGSLPKFAANDRTKGSPEENKSGRGGQLRLLRHVHGQRGGSQLHRSRRRQYVPEL